MPDEDLTSENLPEIPALTTAENDTAATANAPVENSLVQKIRVAGDRILAKAGIKRGRGRPKNCGKCGLPETKCNCAEMAAEIPVKIPVEFHAAPGVEKNPVEIPAVALSDIDAKINSLFRRCISGGAKGVSQGCETVTKIMAASAGIDSEFTEKTLIAARPENDALDNFSEAVQLTLEKRGVKAEKNGDLHCLVLAGGRIVAPYALVWLEFRKEIRRKRELEKGGAK